MKLLIVSQYFYPENFKFNDLAKDLVKDHELTILTGVPNYPQGSFYQGYHWFKPLKESWQGMTIYRCPLIPRKKNSFFLALNYISFALLSNFFAFYFTLTKKIDRILVCQVSPITMVVPAITLRFLKKIPVVLWITDLWPESLRATNAVNNKFVLKLVELFVAWVYRHVDHILISCKGFKTSILSKAPQAKISYYPYWAEDFYQKSTPCDELEAQQQFCLMFAGNMGAAQNLDLLVLAVEKLSQEAHCFKVIMVGDGRERKNLEDLICKKNLQQYFQFVGSYPPEKMPHFFAHADFLYLSLREDPIFEITVPSKLQSYMACGKPIVASINGEASDIIQMADCGFSARANHLDEVIDALRSALESSEERKIELGNNAYQYYQEHFNRSQSMAKIREHLRNTL